MKKSRSDKRKKPSAGPTTTSQKTPQPATEKDSSTTDWASALNTMEKSLEIVEWRDANSDIAEKDWTGDYINATVGWTEEEDEAWLKISSELTPDGERGVTRVPLVNVVRRRRLTIENSPLTWITWEPRTGWTS